MNVEDLRQQLDDIRLKARELATKAAGRDFTDDEAAQAIQLLDQGADVERRLKQAEADAEADAEVKAAIKELGDRIGILGGANTTTAAVGAGVKAEPARPPHPRVKAAGGTGDWGKAIVRAQSDSFGNYKALLPGGAVPVSVPLHPEPVRIGEPVLAVRQLISTLPDTTGRWSYLQQSVRTNNAAVVAHGARKPTSVFSLTRQEERARTIAHLSEPIHRQDLDDAPLLERFLDVEMRLGLEDALEDEIVNGAGTGEHFVGLANVSGSQSQAWTTNILTTTRKAITKLEDLKLTPTGWLFSSADWETLELLSLDSGASFALRSDTAAVPVDRAARRLWGLPVVVSSAVSGRHRLRRRLRELDGAADPRGRPSRLVGERVQP
jgi:HK97 family phage major capsid protein